MAACGHDTEHSTPNEWRRGAVALAQIRAADPDVTPEALAAAARAYASEWPDVTLTTTALASHWSRFRTRAIAASAAKAQPTDRYASPPCEFWQAWAAEHMGWEIDIDTPWQSIPINRRRQAHEAFSPP